MPCIALDRQQDRSVLISEYSCDELQPVKMWWLSLQYKKDCQLEIDLLETDSNTGSMEQHAGDSQQKWSAYIDRFVASDNMSAADTHELTSLASHQPVLLQR